ncbi:MAG: hypothetical protein ACJA1I_002775, partial [Zhongshania marina]
FEPHALVSNGAFLRLYFISDVYGQDLIRFSPIFAHNRYSSAQPSGTLFFGVGIVCPLQVLSE